MIFDNDVKKELRTYTVVDQIYILLGCLFGLLVQKNIITREELNVNLMAALKEVQE